VKKGLRGKKKPGPRECRPVNAPGNVFHSLDWTLTLAFPGLQKKEKRNQKLPRLAEIGALTCVVRRQSRFSPP